MAGGHHYVIRALHPHAEFALASVGGAIDQRNCEFLLAGDVSAIASAQSQHSEHDKILHCAPLGIPL
ncbi:hypothetical protein Mx4_p69 [Myxococcus phage Mx4]|nr:hypothetical protein Mx4_p69 [Myxococcus phage Mx4]